MKPGLPIVPMAFLFGATFGILARSRGLGGVLPIFISAGVFAGSAQFAFLLLLPAGVWTAVLAAVLVNARYLPMGISIASSLPSRLSRRFLHAHLLVDESWAIARRGDGGFDPATLLGLGLLFYVAWVAGTAVGSLSGVTIANPKRLGLDAAFPALFLALLVPQVRDRTAISAALVGAGLTALAIPVLPAGLPVLVACTAALIGGLRRAR